MHCLDCPAAGACPRAKAARCTLVQAYDAEYQRASEVLVEVLPAEQAQRVLAPLALGEEGGARPAFTAAALPSLGRHLREAAEQVSTHGAHAHACVPLCEPRHARLPGGMPPVAVVMYPSPAPLCGPPRRAAARSAALCRHCATWRECGGDVCWLRVAKRSPPSSDSAAALPGQLLPQSRHQCSRRRLLVPLPLLHLLQLHCCRLILVRLETAATQFSSPAAVLSMLMCAAPSWRLLRSTRTKCAVQSLSQRQGSPRRWRA